MKRLITICLALAIICLSTCPIQAVEQGEVYGWGRIKLPNETLGNITQIAAGSYHSLALKSDGSIVGWGSNYDYSLETYLGQATPPEGNDFIAIAAGYYHSLALRKDGSIIGWGDDTYGQATPPAGTGFIAIVAGLHNSLALRLPIVVVEVKITPSALNLNRKGQFVVAHIQMPQDLIISEDEVETILLDGLIEAEDILIGEDKMITARFDRTAVSDYLIDSQLSGEIELTITGKLTDGNVLEGTDTIKILE
jgi:hypothetical protein